MEKNNKVISHYSLFMIHDSSQLNGFTLVELMVSMGILAVLFVLTSVNLTRLPSTFSQGAQIDTLMGDLKSQQTLAMTGSTGGGTENSDFGVHLESNSYTLFTGSSYTPGASTNFIVELEPTLSFTDVTWPGEVVVFSKGTGDIDGYIAGSDNFSVTNSVTGEARSVRLNKYGASY